MNDSELTAVDVDAYLQRIGHHGVLDTSLATLGSLQRGHVQAIAFENLNPLLGLPVPLDAASLMAKLVHGGRGGWCYEHNGLLLRVLRALGFEARGLAARVTWNRPPGELPARTHMLLLVTLEGERWIVDAGFGGQTPTAPLRLDRRDAQPTPHGDCRLLGDDGTWHLEARVDDAWKPMYRFDLAPQHDADYEFASWYQCHHPQSHFRLGLVAARATADGRLTLRNREWTRRTPQGTTQRRLDDNAALRASLTDDFGLVLPDHPALEPTLAALP